MSFGVGVADFPAGAAVIFGGSGGIGSMTAGLIAERGSDVVLTYQSRETEAEQVAAKIRALNRRAICVQVDVRDRSSVEAGLATAEREFGSVHSVVSAQGGRYTTGPLAEVDPEELQNKTQTDIIGFLNIVQSSLPRLRSKGGGSITAIITPAIHRAVPNYALAAIPKMGVIAMVRAFAVEEGRHNIRVNGVSLGVIDAGMAHTVAASPGRALLEKVVAATPLARVGRPEEVAKTIAFLASAKAGYVTGQLIMIDGGYTL